MKDKKMHIVAICASLAIFGYSFFAERYWFEADYLNMSNKIYLVTKIILLIGLLLLAIFVGSLVVGDKI